LPSPVGAKRLWFIGALTALLTAGLMTRMMVMTFWGTERFRERHLNHPADEPSESPEATKATHTILSTACTALTNHHG